MSQSVEWSLAKDLGWTVLAEPVEEGGWFVQIGFRRRGEWEWIANSSGQTVDAALKRAMKVAEQVLLDPASMYNRGRR